MTGVQTCALPILHVEMAMGVRDKWLIQIKKRRKKSSSIPVHVRKLFTDH